MTSLYRKRGHISANVKLKLKTDLELAWWRSHAAAQVAVSTTPLIKTDENPAVVHLAWDGDDTVESMCELIRGFLVTFRPPQDRFTLEFSMLVGQDVFKRECMGGIAIIRRSGWSVVSTKDMLADAGGEAT